MTDTSISHYPDWEDYKAGGVALAMEVLRGQVVSTPTLTLPVLHGINAGMFTAECPNCGATVSFKSAPVLHELIRCSDCGAELEVTTLEPLALDLAPTEEEDWGE
jgi:alpha-aminoadipate carrier protein LysW